MTATNFAFRRAGFSLIELIVVLSIVAILAALLTAAVQRVRAAAVRLECANHLRQIGLGLHQYHQTHSCLPSGMALKGENDAYRYMSWHTRLLPYVEQQLLWERAQRAYAAVPEPFFNNPPHPLSAIVALYTCPADGRSFVSAKLNIGLTSYLGIQGTNQVRKNGVLFVDSRISFAEIRDGVSNTLFVGERPHSDDEIWGYWYAGWGASKDGTGDMILGVRSVNVGKLETVCPFGPYQFGPGTVKEICDVLHFWSLHSGGGHFLFGDGGVRFMSYSANAVLPALATRASGETIPAIE